MKFPSIKYLVSQAGESLARFYLPLLFAFTGTFAALSMVGARGESRFATGALFTSILGISASLGCTLFAERSKKSIVKWLMPLAAVVFILIYGNTLAPHSYVNSYRRIRIFWILAIILHLWVAISPYIQVNDKSGFWRFNQRLYSRIFLALLFSVALYIGLALAVVACNLLLKFNTNYKIHLKLFIWIAGVFNTWFFLAGVPADYTKISQETGFPKTLKTFTQYILMPIVILYIVILYAYGIKILGSWNLPRGWVSILICWCSVLGMLAALLVSPLREDPEMAWVRLFSRLFFIGILPLLVLLFLAIKIRIDRYGITEYRYYVSLIGVWLACISVYFIVSRRKNIKVVPVSLAIIGTLSLVGPWSAFAVSDRSQLHRMEKILIKYNIWTPGQCVNASDTTVDFNDEMELKSIIGYFIERTNIPAMQEVYALDLKQLADDTYVHSNAEYDRDFYQRVSLQTILLEIVSKMKTRVVVPNPWENAKNNADWFFSADLRTGFEMKGYTRVCKYTQNHYAVSQFIYPSASDSLEIKVISENDSACYIGILRNGRELERVDMMPLIHRLRGKKIVHRDFYYNEVPSGELIVDAKGPVPMRIYIKMMRMKDPDVHNNDAVIKELDSWILIK